MIDVSSNYKSEIIKLNRDMHVKMVLSGAINITLTEEDINISTIKLSNSGLAAGILGFGTVSSKSLSFEITNNGAFDGVDLEGVKIVLYSGLGEEFVNVGTFYISKFTQPNQTIEVEAADKISKLDKKFTTTTKAPCAVSEMISDFESQTGITLNGLSSYFLSLTVTEDINNEEFTYIDFLQSLAEMNGGCCFMTNDENIKFICFADQQSSSTYHTCSNKNMRINSKFYNTKRAVTGIIYNNYDSFLDGTTDYCVSIRSNVLMENMSDSNKKSIVDSLYAKYNGFKYFAYEAEMRYDASIEVGDYIVFPDVKTVDGVVSITTFVGNMDIYLNSKITLSAPDTDSIDLQQYQKGYESKKSESSGGGGGEQKVVNPNLLNLSLFTKATLPYSFVDTFEAGDDKKYTTIKNVNGSNGIECLNALDMSNITTSKEYYPRVWLPCSGVVQGGTYTLSLLLRPLMNKAAYVNYPIKIYFIKKTQTYTITKRQMNIDLNGRFSDNGAYSKKIMEFNMDSLDWKWYTFTFTFDENPEEWMLGLQPYSLGNPYLNRGAEYAFYIHKAKLEEGDTATDWCLGSNEHISAQTTNYASGNVKKTYKANTQSLIADYGPMFYIESPVNIFYDSKNGVTIEGMQEIPVKDSTLNAPQLSFMIKTTSGTDLDDSSNVFTKQYRDNSNNFYIDCNNFYLNGSVSTGGSGSGGSSGDSGSGDSGNTGGSGDSGSGDSGNTGGSSEITGDEASTYTDTTGHSYFELDSGTIDNMTSKQVVSFFNNDITPIISDYENNNSDEYSNKVLSDWYFYITARLAVDSNLSTYVVNNTVDSRFSDDSFISNYDKYSGYIDDTGYAYEEIDSNYLDSLTARRLYQFFVSDIVPIKDYYAENSTFEGWQDESKSDGWYVYINARKEADEYLQEYINNETIDDYFINKFY